MTTERFNAEVGADIREFQRKMRQVDEQMRELATGVSVEINLALSEFYAEIARVNSQLADLEAEKVQIEIEAIITDFKKKLLQVRTLAENLDNESIDIEVTLDLDVFYLQVRMVEAELKALERMGADIKIKSSTSGIKSDVTEVESLLASIRDANIEIGADIKQFLRGAAIVKGVKKELERKPVIVKIWMDYTSAMKKYASTVRAFGEATQQMLIGTLLTLIPVLSQLISVSIGLIGSLGVMVGVLAGQFMIMASAVGIAAVGFVGLAAVAIPTIKTLFDETAKLNAEQQRARDSFDQFKATYDGLVKATEKPVLQAFTSAMNGANSILKSLEPLILSVADSAAKLAEAFNQSINSAPIQKIFDTFNKYGAEIFENVVTGIGHLVAALGSMVAAFAPAAKEWSKSFNGMMKSFAEWSDGLTQSKGFQSFINYVQTYGPEINAIFGNLVLGIVDFFKAFSGIGGGFISGLREMTAQFRDWAAALGENQQFQRFLDFIVASTPAVLELIGNLWNLLINLGIALAPVGAMVLELTNNFLAWFNSILETEGVISKLVGLLPVLLGVVSTMAPVFVSAFAVFKNLSPLFTTIISGIGKMLPMFTALLKSFTSISGVLRLVSAAFAAVTGPITIAVVAIGLLVAAVITAYKKVDWFRDMVNKAWAAIKEYTVKAFNAIYDTVEGAITKVWDFIKDILGKLEVFWKEHGDTITAVVKTAFETLYDSISNTLKIITIVIETAWDIIVGVFRIAWDLIEGIIDVALDLILGIIDVALDLLTGNWGDAWDTMVDVVNDITITIIDTIASILGEMWQIGVDLVEGIIDGIVSQFNFVKKTLDKLSGYIPNWVKEALGIHSPSRVMAAVAKWIPAGIAKGILDNVNLVKSASKKMSDSMTLDFSKQVNKASSEYKRITDVVKEVAKANEKITKETTKVNGKTVTTYIKLTNAERLAAFETALSDHKKYNNVSAEYERQYWMNAAKELKAGSAARRAALANAEKARLNMLKEQYANETHYVDMAVKYGMMGLAQQITAYERYMKQYKVGSEEQIAYEEQIYDKKKELYDGLKSLADDYLSKVQDVYARLAEEEKALRDEWQRTYDDRVSTLANTFGLFGEVNLTQMVEFDDEGNITKQIDLLQNLRDQVKALSDFSNNLFVLESRGLSGELIRELQQLGPQAGAEIQALTKMTQSELDEFQMLFDTRTALARKQATTELEGARLEMEEQIKLLNENAVKELELLNKNFLAEVKKLTGGAEDGFNVMNMTLPQIGKSAVEGLINGMKSMEGKLKNTAQKLANDVQSILSQTLGVDGAINAAGNAISLPNNALSPKVKNNFTTSATRNINQNIVDETAFAETQVNVTLSNQFNGEEFETWLDGRSANNIKLKTYKKG